MVWAPLRGVAPPVLAATDCACLDQNGNGVCDPGDIPVPDAAWLGGATYVAPGAFLVPANCDHTLTTVRPPLLGVKVVAPKITFNGKLQLLPAGGHGVVLVADPGALPVPGLGDGSITVGDGLSEALISAGGINTLPTSLPAVPQKSVALQATGPCSINNARIEGNRPLTINGVGILCTNDILLRRAAITGSTVNIQSLLGKIDARAFPSGPSLNVVLLCDDPATNLTGNGNLNFVMDAADFPCTPAFADLPPVTFDGPDQLLAFCQAPVVAGPNRLQSVNDPLIMISQDDLDLGSPPGSPNEVGARFRVTLVAVDGDVNVANSRIGGGTTVPGTGPVNFVFANPANVVRLPTGREDIFGPCTGALNVTNACFEGPVRVCAADVIGSPAPPPCTQLPLPIILDGNF
jgi:hypothetical protein